MKTRPKKWKSWGKYINKTVLNCIQNMLKYSVNTPFESFITP